MASELWVCHLGQVEYHEGVALQEQVRERVQAGELPGVLLALEHPPVYTRGRRSDPSELPMGEDWYRSQGIDIAQTDRGGRLTYHGPGQLVGYPIMRVSDVVAHLRTMEEAIIAALGDDAIVIRSMTYLCMSWDHRALDGALAAQFLAALRARLESWAPDGGTVA